MIYTPVLLFALGVAGVLAHNLVKINDLNKKPEFNFTLQGYIKTEIYSIILSLLIVGVCVVTSQEIKELEQVGKWLGLAFVSIGYMGQSLLIKFMGKAEKIMQ